MKMHLFFLLVHTYILAIHCSFMKENNYISVTNKIHNVESIGSLVTRSVTECVVRCSENTACIAANIGQQLNGTRKICQILASEQTQYDQLTVADGWRYLHVDDCADYVTCHNGGSKLDLGHSCVCDCLDGFTGHQCETDYDECSSSPCQNSVQCNDQVNSYSCTCQAGYVGTHCEIDIDDCATSPCQNRGTCVDGVNTYSCTCDPAFSGTNCQTAHQYVVTTHTGSGHAATYDNVFLTLTGEHGDCNEVLLDHDGPEFQSNQVDVFQFWCGNAIGNLVAMHFRIDGIDGWDVFDVEVSTYGATVTVACNAVVYDYGSTCYV